MSNYDWFNDYPSAPTLLQRVQNLERELKSLKEEKTQLERKLIGYTKFVVKVPVLRTFEVEALTKVEALAIVEDKHRDLEHNETLNFIAATVWEVEDETF